MDPRDNDHLDQWLDKALRQYGNAEPRTGLGGRVLANLATARDRSVVQRRWFLAFASLAVLCAVSVAVWVGSNSHRHDKPVGHISRSPIVKAQNGTLGNTLSQHSGLAHTQTPRHTQSILKSVRPEMARLSPRLEQFPSQRPLTEQEQLLRAFVSDFPKEASVVAQEQAEREKELGALYTDVTPYSNSEEEKR